MRRKRKILYFGLGRLCIFLCSAVSLTYVLKQIFTGKLSIKFLKMCECIIEFLRVYQCIFNNLKCLATMSQSVKNDKQQFSRRV